MIKMNLKKVYFDLIKSGKKLYEVRLYDEKRSKIEVLDYIEFSCDSNLETVKTQVVEILKFNCFKDCLEQLPLEKLGFYGQSKEMIESVYNDIYAKEKQNKYGVVAFKIKLI